MPKDTEACRGSTGSLSKTQYVGTQGYLCSSIKNVYDMKLIGKRFIESV